MISKKELAIGFSPLVASIPATVALADESGVVTSTDWSTVITALTKQISVGTIVGVLAVTVAAGVGLVFMWWGVRKAVRTIMSAFRKGRMSV